MIKGSKRKGRPPKWREQVSGSASTGGEMAAGTATSETKVEMLPKRAPQVIPAATIQEGHIFKQVVDGYELIFQYQKGEISLVKKIPLFDRSIRYFRIPPMPSIWKKIRKEKRFWYNPGPGQRVLRWIQQNFQGDRHDPAKESVVKIEDKETALKLASRRDHLEEVGEKEYLLAQATKRKEEVQEEKQEAQETPEVKEAREASELPIPSVEIGLIIGDRQHAS